MRQTWRLLLRRNFHHHHRNGHRHFQVQPLSSLDISTTRTHSTKTLQNPFNTTYLAKTHAFSTQALTEPEKESDHHSLVSGSFLKFSDLGDVNKELGDGVVISHDLVLKVLKSLSSTPDAARRFFDWVLEKDGEKVGSKAHNLMLGILSSHGFVEEFWGLVETMKKKGYGVSKGTRDKVLEKFEQEGLESDVDRLRGVFASGSIDDSVEKMGLRVSRIIRNNVWGEEVEKQITELNLQFDSEVVSLVVQNLAMEPTKALIFFRWVEESGMCKHDERSYNSIARVLGREDSIDRFWKVSDEMRSKGCEMDEETYATVSGRFLKRKLLKEWVELYEFAMAGANNPQVQCCTFLLKKIASSKEMNMALFSRVMNAFLRNGNAVTDSMVNSVLKSLTSTGRLGECNKVLKEMKEGGFVAGGGVQGKIALRLSRAGKKEEASEFVGHIGASNLDPKAWASLVEGYCVSGDLETALDSFKMMVAKKGVYGSAKTFDVLVNAYCCRDRAVEAVKLVHDQVTENQLKPWHTTYKRLITKLLVQGGFSDALNLLDLMKKDGFPHFVDPIIEYISKSGTSDNALALMKAITSKKFPSTSVVLRLFESFSKAGRLRVAQDFLSKCPSYIRNHADVLNLFCAMKSTKGTVVDDAAPVAV